MDITTSKSSALAILSPLIFETQFINGVLLLKTNFFSPRALSFEVLVAVTLAAISFGSSISSAINASLSTVISPLTTIYASE